MGKRARYRPVVLFRRFLFLALVVFAAWVFYLLATGRRAELPTRAAETPLAEGELAELAFAGKGFEHVVTEQDRAVFRIKADRVLSDRRNMFVLEKVDIERRLEGGDTYRIRADKATYRAEPPLARVEGSVRITSSGGVDLRGDAFELRRNGRVVASDSPVAFIVRDELAGRARSVAYHLKREWLNLQGRVKLYGTAGKAAGVALSARHVTYEREEGLVVAEGAVTLEQAGTVLQSKRLSAVLAEDGGRARFVRARWEVEAVAALERDADMGKRMRLAGDELSFTFDDAGELAEAEVEAAGERAWIEVFDETGLARRLAAPRVVATFRAGEPATARAFGPVRVVDYFLFDPDFTLLEACAEAASAAFAGGDVERLTLEGDVDLLQGPYQARGDTLVASGSRRIELAGAPARLYTERGELAAPRIVYLPPAGDATAEEGVDAVLSPASGVSLLRGEAAREPVRVTSERAEWSSESGRYAFIGGVRAWQGENFLVAERLVGEPEQDRLRAEGKVKTVIKRDDKGTAAPIEVSAAELLYDSAARQILYRGAPKARQAGRSFSCQELDVTLDAASEIEEVLCRGDAEIVDPGGGNTVRGRLATYRPQSGSVMIEGEPAILRKSDGTELRGGRVAYDLETAVARVLTTRQADDGEGQGSG